MQNIIIEKPYRFVPPYRGKFWSAMIQRFNLHSHWLKRQEGVEWYEVRDGHKLRASLEAGHGVMLTPNHCRNADPIVLGWLAREVNCHLYAMASWHLFNQDWFSSWAIRMMGAFSVNREGVDKQAINTAIEILQHAERPLVIFPEGAVSRTNDRLHALLDGIAFIGRTAAKRRLKDQPDGKVVIHPVAIKYLFHGDLHTQADPVLREIEHRFTWRPQLELPLADRVAKAGLALLSLKELEYFGESQTGPLEDRLARLIDRLLSPLEEEWLGAANHRAAVVPRVKAIRMKILPEMVGGTLDKEERDRRWRQLADVYLAQQVSCYQGEYLISRPSVDRYLETIERFEEDLKDKARVHGKLKAVIQVGDPIDVSPKRERRDNGDPLMAELAERLQGMMDQLALESPLLK